VEDEKGSKGKVVFMDNLESCVFFLYIVDIQSSIPHYK
jgi:hypothetical protein